MARAGSWPERRHGVDAHDSTPATRSARDHGGAGAPTVRRTAFVLSGGATRGATQVGMLLALTEAGVVPDFIVGTSVGALNAACYAADPTTSGLERIARRWVDAPRAQIFPLSLRAMARHLGGRSGHLLPNDGLQRWIATNTTHRRLEELPIPVHVVAADAASGRPVVLSTGDIITALLASTAIPRIFPPVEVDGVALIDGAVAADTPVAQAVALGASTIYVLPAATDSRFEAACWRMFDRLVGGPEAAPPDHVSADATVHVLPTPRSTSHAYTFRTSRQLIDEARALTRSFCRSDDHPAQPSEVAWPSLIPSTPSSTLQSA